MKKVLAILALFCAVCFAQEKGTFTDSRDGKTYKIVKIGEQVWMAQNLDYVSGSCYDNKSENCEKYGRLYDWVTAMTLPESCNEECEIEIKNPHQGICPSGWHLPNSKEWQILIDFAGGDKVAGKKLKAKEGWSNKGNGTDDYGFSALPSGLYIPHFYESIGEFAYGYGTNNDKESFSTGMGKKTERSSVRCVKD